MQISAVEVILFVADQQRSCDFYSALLDMEPVTDVPGMTEFALPGMLLGLMPERGIKRILQEVAPDPASGNGIPRCELYLRCSDVAAAFARAISLGAVSVSIPLDRDWGDRVAYVLDPDGHVIAFAKKL